MICKYIGVGLLLLGAFLFGYQKIRSIRIQGKLLHECIGLIQYIYKNISFFEKPIPAILAEHHSEILAAYGFYDVMTKTNELSATIQTLARDLPAEGYDVLLRYASSAGKGYKEEELQWCSYTIEILTDLEKKIHTENQNRVTLFKTLPVLLVLSVVLLFW